MFKEIEYIINELSFQIYDIWPYEGCNKDIKYLHNLNITVYCHNLNQANNCRLQEQLLLYSNNVLSKKMLRLQIIDKKQNESEKFEGNDK